MATKFRLDAGAIAQRLGHLEVVATCIAGFDHIDVAAARERVLLVDDTPGLLPERAADFAMMLTSTRAAGRANRPFSFVASGTKRFWASKTPGCVHQNSERLIAFLMRDTSRSSKRSSRQIILVSGLMNSVVVINKPIDMALLPFENTFNRPIAFRLLVQHPVALCDQVW